MLTFKDLFKKQAKQRDIPQKFIATDAELQNTYLAICQECSRLANQFYEVENQLTQNDIEQDTDLYKRYLVRREYLEVEQAKLDQFIKYHDIKF
ncbi:MAG: hypothetical protein ACRCWM_02375 [Sarcina sp.]